MVHVVSHAVDPVLIATGKVLVHKVRRPRGWDLAGQPLLSLRAGQIIDALRRNGKVHVVANGGNFATDDVNWVHTVHAAWVPHDAAFPFLTRLKNRVTRELNRHDERRAFQAARVLVANSELCKRAIISVAPHVADRIRVIYLGVDESYGPAESSERTSARRRFGLADGEQAIVFIGSMGLDGRKGLDTAISVLERLRQAPGWAPRLLVAGRGSATHWSRVVAEASLTGSVAILGELESSKAILAAADLVLSPTRFDAYGLGVHEALCRGIPAFVSANAGVVERLPLSLRFLVLESLNDPAAYARRIVDTFPLSRASAEALSGFSFELRKRSWRHMAEEIRVTVEG